MSAGPRLAALVLITVATAWGCAAGPSIHLQGNWYLVPGDSRDKPPIVVGALVNTGAQAVASATIEFPGKTFAKKSLNPGRVAVFALGPFECFIPGWARVSAPGWEPVVVQLSGALSALPRGAEKLCPPEE